MACKVFDVLQANLKDQRIEKKKTNSSFSKIFDWLKTISLTTCCN